MCIIIGKPVGIELPTEEVLDYCASRNRDGIGIAYTSESIVKIKKDFNDVGALKTFLKENVTPSHGALIHFRIATAGLSDEGNRHPFPITRRRKRLRALESVTDLAVAHNGTLEDLKGHKKYSDTLLFIKNVLSDPVVRNNLHSNAIQELVGGYLGTSKMAIIDRQGVIMKFGDFVSEWGLIFSHSGYKAYCSPSYTDGKRSKNGFDRQCIVCYEFIAEDYMQEIANGIWICRICNVPKEYKSTTVNRKGDDNA